jgi:hypothetical protein
MDGHRAFREPKQLSRLERVEPEYDPKGDNLALTLGKSKEPTY